MPERYFGLIWAIYHEMKNPSKVASPDWMVLIDDDTFFMRPSALSHALLTAYPTAASTPLFLGAETEIIRNRKQEGSIFLGGAGMFLSFPLAGKLVAPHRGDDDETSYWERCRQEDEDIGGGDARVSRCVNRYTETPMTTLPGLHQMSIFGDVSGFYESGHDFFSIHHWKSWHWLDPVKSSLVGDVCGEDCILQRFQFDAVTQSARKGAKSSAYTTNPLILTNGYSISEYTKGINFDTRKTENTFDPYLGYSVDQMDYGVGQLRDKVEGKLQWRLLDAVIEDDGVVQWYGWIDENNDLAKIAELTWLHK